jgi:hypothetical protein
MDRKLLAVSQDIDALMDGASVRQFFGGKSKMTIHRRMNDPELGFPQPMKIVTQNYWTKRQLLEFIERQHRKSQDRLKPDICQREVGRPHQNPEA